MNLLDQVIIMHYHLMNFVFHCRKLNTETSQQAQYYCSSLCFSLSNCFIFLQISFTSLELHSCMLDISRSTKNYQHIGNAYL